MGNLTIRIGSGLILILILMGSALAGTFDFNPGQEVVEHKNDVTSDVTGTGYVIEYVKVNTNNLSMKEYSHGSGTMDFADILSDQQKSSSTIYWIDYTKEDFVKSAAGASSTISYTRQYDNVQSPASFAYGTGYYASHPVIYNSLLKDKNEAKSYQEEMSAHRQIEYARAAKGDLAVDLNCTAPTATTNGVGSISMKTDDDITQGTLHVGELLAMPLKANSVPKYGMKNEGLKTPIIDIETDYIGDFQVQKTMKITVPKYSPSWAEDWLPCCSGGFFDLPSRFFDKQYASQKGIFDCTCRNSSISTMKPAWNTTMAQFPTDKYQYKP
jgi:hypothetical protein